MSELLPPDDLDLGADVSTPLVLNLERLRELPEQDTEPVARYAADIAHQRKTHETLLQIRSGDIDLLAELCNVPTTELTTRLVSWVCWRRTQHKNEHPAMEDSAEGLRRPPQSRQVQRDPGLRGHRMAPEGWMSQFPSEPG